MSERRGEIVPARPRHEMFDCKTLYPYGLSFSRGGFASGKTEAIIANMESTKYIYWQDSNQWLGYLQDYPDYWTQGESLEDLQAHLRDLYRDLTSGEIPGVRKLAELTLR